MKFKTQLLASLFYFVGPYPVYLEQNNQIEEPCMTQLFSLISWIVLYLKSYRYLNIA